jgi:hypothetical protein
VNEHHPTKGQTNANSEDGDGDGEDGEDDDNGDEDEDGDKDEGDHNEDDGDEDEDGDAVMYLQCVYGQKPREHSRDDLKVQSSSKPFLLWRDVGNRRCKVIEKWIDGLYNG